MAVGYHHPAGAGGQLPPRLPGGDEPPGRLQHQPLLAKVVPRSHCRPGRHRLDDRKVLCGISSCCIPGFSGSTCRRSWVTWRRVLDPVGGAPIADVSCLSSLSGSPISTPAARGGGGIRRHI